MKLHLSYNLHAKLYLAYRNDPDNPVTSYLGSSNLTMSGLRKVLPRPQFPDRVLRTVVVPTNAADDPHRQLYDTPVVEAIGNLSLPRYGLTNYLKANAAQLATDVERPLLDNLSRAGKRLMGFCRINLFKRLMSGGAVFLQSLDRHLRHTVATELLEKGYRIETVQRRLGHKDIRTNMGYAEVSAAQVRAKLEGSPQR